INTIVVGNLVDELIGGLHQGWSLLTPRGRARRQYVTIYIFRIKNIIYVHLYNLRKFHLRKIFL
ncbi:unnamed protein product, partial [Brassica rapa subsp. narinosa]